MRKFTLLLGLTLFVSVTYAQYAKNNDAFFKKHVESEYEITSTALKAEEVYFTEDFEGKVLPSEWEIYSKATDDGYLFGTSSELSSKYWTIPDNGGNFAASNDDECNCDKSDDRLITSSFDLSNATNAFLSFDYVFQASGSENFEVFFSIDNGKSWNLFEQVAETKIPGTSGKWMNYVIALGSLNGKDDVKLAFRYHDGKDWGYGLALDNISVFMPIELTDVLLAPLNIKSNYRLTNQVAIQGEIQNLGTDTIKSIVIKWNGGSTDYTQTLENIAIAPFRKISFIHKDLFNCDAKGYYSLIVSLEEPNGIKDENPSNNSNYKDIQVWDDFLDRTVLVEEFSTEKCPNCPPVATYLGGIANENENVILMVHHAGYYTDPYTIPENTEMLTFFNAGGGTFAPAGMMDRHYNGKSNDGSSINPGPVFWPGEPFGEIRIDDRLNEVAMVDVDIDGIYNSETNQINVTVSGSFKDAFSEKLGVSLWILEDGIVSDNQAGFSGEWTHHALVRDAISATFGNEITSGTNIGDQYTQDFSYTVDSEWDIDELTLVAFVNTIDAGSVNNRTVHNVKSMLLTDLNKVRAQIKVDMSSFAEFDEMVEKVYLEGSFQNEKIEMVSPTDGFYFASVFVEPNTTYSYKYSTTKAYEVEDREVIVEVNDLAVDDIFSTNIKEKVKAILNLDMSNYTGADASFKQVFVEGSFGMDKIEMLTTDSKNYSVTIFVDPDSTYSYKYSTHRMMEIENRDLVIAGEAVTINDIFNLPEDEKPTLFLNVNMSTISEFNGDTDKVYVEGSFGSDKIEMVTSDNMNYSTEISVDPNTIYTYRYSTLNTAEIDTREVEITLSYRVIYDNFEMVGVNNDLFNAVKFYPNPFNNTLTIDNLDKESQVTISNVLGQTVMSITVTDSKMEINTSELNKGVYLITVLDSNNNSRTERMVKH